MAQSIATRAALLTRLNARTEVFIAKLADENRDDGAALRAADADLLTPVIPGLYLLDLSLVFRSAISVGTQGFSITFTGPLGITDGGYGSFAQLGIPQRNSAGTGLETIQNFVVGAALTNVNQYVNRSGWFAVREPGDLVLTWNSILAGGSGVDLLRGSSIHLVRAINDRDTP